MAKSTTVSTGIGFPGLLTIVFITLKLLGKIEWSWLWVLAPTWIPFGLLAVFLLFCGVMALLSKVLLAVLER